MHDWLSRFVAIGLMSSPLHVISLDVFSVIWPRFAE